MEPIPINLVVEDHLSEAVLRTILQSAGHVTGVCYGKKGRGYIEKKIGAFNTAARGTPYCVLADLNSDLCSPELVAGWFAQTKHHNLLFCVAVKEVESWLLGDRDGLAKFLLIPRQKVPVQVDNIDRPKELLIKLTKSSRSRLIREDIVPRPGSTAKIGPNYNGRLIAFVQKKWNIRSASINSESLQRAVERVKRFTPQWATPTQ
jgi:hypothetical protein